MTTIRPDTILIAPIGEFDPYILDAVKKMIGRVFQLPVRIEPMLDNIDFAWNGERRQFHSTAILSRLSDNAPTDAVKIIALTHEDLFIPILTYVYGEAELGGKSSIVSTCRLAGGISPGGRQNLYLARIVKEAAHELGHTFDLRHCKDRFCLMHYCRNIIDVDNKENRFCRYCKVMLEDQLKRINS